MAASSMCQDESDQFMQWLEGRLLQLNADLDVSVFVMYICGILDSYSGYDDKKEYLLDIVGEIAEEDKDAVCDELIQKWDEMSNADCKKANEPQTAMEEKLSQMLGNTHVTTTTPVEKKSKPLSDEEKARKQAILAQYSNVCDEPDLEVETVEEVADAAAPTSSQALIAAAAILPVSQPAGLSLVHNANKDNVSKREKEMREKLKQENEKKKEKDKQDREMQKNKKQDRKETEKKRTQKGERRR